MTKEEAAAKGYTVEKVSPYEVGLCRGGRGIRTWWASEFGGKLPDLDHPTIMASIETDQEMKEAQ